LILACLAKDPAERPADAATIEQTLTLVVASEWSQARAKEWWDGHRTRISQRRSSIPVRGSETTLVPADDPLRL
jgi:hypothetical protein